MTELEAAIQEHMALKRRRGDPVPEAPGVEDDARIAAVSAARVRVAANGVRAVADRPLAVPAAATAVPRSFQDVDAGLISPDELAARRASAHERARRVRRLRRWLTGAGVVGIAVILIPAIVQAASAITSAVSGGSHHVAVRRRVRTVPATYPFDASPAQRATVASDRLEPFWADGQPCSVGCRARGVIPGWPLRPFHAQHALRAGLNEQRVTSFHHGIDIQAYDGTPVYAIQPGRAQILQATGGDARVLVGNFIYWHIHPRVREGQRIAPYRQVVGTILAHHGHLHLSELDASKRYINPLRPGGRALDPYNDTAAPVIDRPRLSPEGHVVVRVFDPQSFRVTTTYQTPVIAPAAVAYRIFDRAGQRLGPLHWALRGSQNLEWTPETDAAIYATGSHPELGNCFERQAVCRPNYRYVVAGGLAPPLTQLLLPADRYRLTIYVWDWAGNTTARDAYFTVRNDGTVAG